MSQLGWNATGIKWVETRDAVKQPDDARTRNYPATMSVAAEIEDMPTKSDLGLTSQDGRFSNALGLS